MALLKQNKIGIGIPCHVRDVGIVRRTLASIDELDPGPYRVKVYVNDGSQGMGYVRRRLFDKLFRDEGCDVVLACSADFGLMRGILKHVDPHRVTSFGFLRRHPADVIHVFKRFISRRAWSGCYSIPRWVWDRFREVDWDGSDSAIDVWCRSEGLEVKRVRMPRYWVLRFSGRMREAAVGLPSLRARITRLASAW